MLRSKNTKAPMVLYNRSNYFSPDKDRVYNRFLSPESWRFKNAKVQGYENRTYWEYKYCLDNNGQTFYYTFTYNNRAMPKDPWLHKNCFDYDHLIYLLNGGLKQILKRKYATKFKYFVGAELGEGAGSRGYANNPHYHILFFLRPYDKPVYRIDRKKLVVGYYSRNSKYHKKGDPKIKVFKSKVLVPYKKIDPKDFCSLCRKYWQGFDQDITGWHSFRTAKFGKCDPGDNCGLVYSFAADVYCSKYVCKDVTLRKREYRIKKFLINKYTSEGKDPNTVSDLVDEAIKLFRNKYSNKCRVSQGVGDYALDQIIDIYNPSISIPTKDGPVDRPIGLYYFRKLFTEVVKDGKNQNIRVLTPEGLVYQSKKLNESLSKLVIDTLSNVSVLSSKLYYSMTHSDLNVYTNMDYNTFRSKIDDLSLIVDRYAEYKLVYEDRYYTHQFDPVVQSWSVPDIDVVADYKRFLVPSFYKVDFNPDSLRDFLDSDCEGYISYDAHPYFCRYICVFRVFDLLSDYLFVQADSLAEQSAEQRKALIKFHKSVDPKYNFKS